ncbi:polysaccharide biosynthesis/export family protein [Aestuariivita boseongensis]|uniref:polysaccharide biosynthesis/export family protein n=1 Tax=Aestuariivita boseongensis TaxID=1470562 RepID=UPI00067FB91A|nr:polysaccharide biosynthesis/export family protein [Aestuariivita boseongensis]
MIRLLTSLLFVVGLVGTAAAQSSYSIQPGDTLQIEVLEDPNLNRNVLVLPDGSISFPLAGTVSAGGRSVDAVAGTLANSLGANFAAPPTVLVSVASLAPRAKGGKASPRLMSVYILGEANAPGRKEVEPGTTLLQFLAEAGGLSRFAAEKRIQLRRVDKNNGQETVYLFNYRTMGGEGSISAATVLAPGDVVFIPERRLFE